MNEGASRSQAALVRWRTFEESLAERGHRNATAIKVAALDRKSNAISKCNSIVEYRSSMLLAGALEFARLQVVAELEEAASREADICTQEVLEAERARIASMEQHVEAKARRRVVETRNERREAAVRDRLEKRLFDQSSYLRGQASEGGILC